MSKDVEELDGELIKDPFIARLVHSNHIFKIIIVAFGVAVVALIAVLIINMSQSKFYQKQQKLLHQQLYSLNQSAEFKKTRKSLETKWIANVLLTYHPYWDANKLSRLAEHIYQKAVMEKHLQIEEVGVLIAYESRGNPNAQNKDTEATGLMQIMYMTGKYIAPAMGIKWEGFKTLKDPFKNTTMGIQFYYDMKKRFGMKKALIAFGCGPTKLVKWTRKGGVPKGAMTYYWGYLKMKAKVERDTGNIIYIEDLPEKDVHIARKKYYQELELQKKKGK